MKCTNWMIISCVLVNCLLIVGCGNKSKILGRWTNDDFGETYEFRADGKYEYSGSGNIRHIISVYSVEGNHLYLTVRMPSNGEWRDEITVYKINIKGDVLTLTRPTEPNVTYSLPSIEYKRVR